MRRDLPLLAGGIIMTIATDIDLTVERLLILLVTGVQIYFVLLLNFMKKYTKNEENLRNKDI